MDDDDFRVSAKDLISVCCAGGVGSDRIDGRVCGRRLSLSEAICAFMSVSSFLRSSTSVDLHGFHHLSKAGSNRSSSTVINLHGSNRNTACHKVQSWDRFSSSCTLRMSSPLPHHLVLELTLMPMTVNCISTA